MTRLIFASLLILADVRPAAAELPTHEQLVGPTWCYATNAGEDVETWHLAADGTAKVTVYRDRGSRIRRAFEDATWTLKKDRLVIRVPKEPTRKHRIKEFASKRLTFTDQTQALTCRPR